MLGRITGRRDGGDTLIEVLFAITIFSVIVVGGLSLMNRGLATSQRSVEMTLVRQQVDAQAEALRFMHSSYLDWYVPGVDITAIDTATKVTPAGQYAQIITRAKVETASPFNTGTTCGGYIPDSFVINTRTARVYYQAPTPASQTLALTFNKDPTSYAQIQYSATNALTVSDGVWVEAVKSPPSGTAAGYIDFHIRACWYSVGTDAPSRVGTIVRLYEPRA